MNSRYFLKLELFCWSVSEKRCQDAEAVSVGCSTGKSVEQGKKINWHDEMLKQVVVILLP